MADTQITILGMSGAGKTCYLLGLYYKMGAGLKGFTITTDEDMDVSLRDRYARLCDVSLDKEQRFPAGTDNISQYVFNLQYGYKTIMSFDWVDYPGAVLERKSTGNLEDYETIKQSINKSSSLFICVDGSLLTGDDVDEKIENVRDNCSNVINTFFSEYFAENRELPPTAIIITKYDVCKDDTNPDELCEIIEESFNPFFTQNEDKKIVTIIPVSLGTNIMDDGGKGKMRPLNIHLPIFMAIWFSLSKKIQEYQKDIERQKSIDESNISNLKGKKINEESKWFFKNKEEIQRLATAISNAEAAKNSKTKEMTNLLNMMSSNSDRLASELEKIPFVYVNGEKSSFSAIIR